MSKVKTDELASTITRNLNNWCDDIESGIEKDLDEVTQIAEKQLHSKSPKRTGRYARGWKTRKSKNSRTLYNKDKPQLTHLLEKGHLSRNGRRVQPRKHIEPVEEWAIQELTQKIEERIKNGS